MLGLLLKENTKNLHDLVEEKLLSHKILDRSFTLKEYQTLLHYNFSFISEFEEAVFNALSIETKQKLNIEKRIKRNSLGKDLAFFGADTSETTSAPTVKNEAEALGILYVMEGATLGGNVIAKSLAKNPAFVGIKLHYFGLYAENSGVLWKEFREVLEDKSASYPSGDFLDGAKRAYRFLLDL